MEIKNYVKVMNGTKNTTAFYYEVSFGTQPVPVIL
jgi:hypothetical protein